MTTTCTIRWSLGLCSNKSLNSASAVEPPVPPFASDLTAPLPGATPTQDPRPVLALAMLHRSAGSFITQTLSRRSPANPPAPVLRTLPNISVSAKIRVNAYRAITKAKNLPPNISEKSLFNVRNVEKIFQHASYQDVALSHSAEHFRTLPNITCNQSGQPKLNSAQPTHYQLIPSASRVRSQCSANVRSTPAARPIQKTRSSFSLLRQLIPLSSSSQ
jgi:hypothetical protein